MTFETFQGMKPKKRRGLPGIGTLLLAISFWLFCLWLFLLTFNAVVVEAKKMFGF